jgi:SAM-dependent methyltransferase
MSKNSNQEINKKIEYAREYDLEIKKHYDKVARLDKESSSCTMSDKYIRENETIFIKNLINKFTSTNVPKKNNLFTILDVGCGNGHSLEILSNIFPNFEFQGLEFNQSLRQIASNRFTDKKIQIRDGDIRNKKTLPNEKVDILICQRVLINLLDEKDQKIALDNLIDLVNRDGLLIFIESFKSGLQNLNSARKEFELQELPPAHHNLYLNDNFFLNKLLKEFDNSQSELLSTHYFVSRVLHETFLKANKKEFFRNSHFVSFFSKAFPKSIGNYSPIKLLSYKKL